MYASCLVSRTSRAAANVRACVTGSLASTVTCEYRHGGPTTRVQRPSGRWSDWVQAQAADAVLI